MATPSNEMSGWRRSPERGPGTVRTGPPRLASGYTSEQPLAVNNQPRFSRDSDSWDRKEEEFISLRSVGSASWSRRSRRVRKSSMKIRVVFVKATFAGAFPRWSGSWAASPSRAGSWACASCWKKWWKGWQEQEGKPRPLRRTTIDCQCLCLQIISFNLR